MTHKVAFSSYRKWEFVLTKAYNAPAKSKGQNARFIFGNQHFTLGLV